MVASRTNSAADNQPRWTPEETHTLIGPTLARIATFSNLEADWDSYGAAPPSPAAQAEAERWVAIVASLFSARAGEHARPYSVAPLADGGVQLEWRGRGGHVELDIGPDGELGYLLTITQGNATSDEEADDASWSDILRLLIRILVP